jgi:hypothetical protein
MSQNRPKSFDSRARAHQKAKVGTQSDLSRPKIDFGCSYWEIWKICIFRSTQDSQMRPTYTMQHPESRRGAVSRVVSHATEHAKSVKISTKNVRERSIF